MEKEIVLVVDDIQTNREILISILENKYEIMEASNGLDALKKINLYEENIKLILLDLIMPEMDGFQVLENMNQTGLIKRIPVIMITAAYDIKKELIGLKLGCSDFVSKPFHSEIVKHKVFTQIQLTNHRNFLEKSVEDNVQKMIKVRESIINVMASVIEYRHVESGKHVKRTKEIAERLLKHIRVSEKMRKELETIDDDSLCRAIPLHDIGKISTPDHILLKPGKLDQNEFNIMKEHTVQGAKIIDSMQAMEDPEYLMYCKNICLYHHEKWDGTGYPHGLKGKEIPFPARLMAIVDVYDALTSKRVYKSAYSHQEAIEIIGEGIGKHFDPVMGNIFIEKNHCFV